MLLGLTAMSTLVTVNAPGAAHCALGKVTKPHARKHHKLPPLVVGSQSPRSGRRLANGAKVAVTLVKAPSRPKRR